MSILSNLLEYLRRGIAKKENRIDVAKKYLDEARSSFSMGRSTFISNSVGRHTFIYFLGGIDKCCAAIYSLFQEIPQYFEGNPGLSLQDLYEAKLKRRKGLSPEMLKAIELVARISTKYGSAYMFTRTTPSRQWSDAFLMRQLSNAAEEAIRCTEEVVDIFAAYEEAGKGKK